MAERNIIMKNVKKIISAMLSGAMALTICASTTLTVSAAEPYQEFESRYDPDQTVAQNSSFSDSELLPYSGLTGGSYSYVAGNFNSNDNYTDTEDYYRFGLGKSDGSNGRIAIKLEGIPAGHNYDLYLYDENQNLVASSKRLSNKNEIIRTPAISKYTSYYILVKAETVPDHSNSSYRLSVGDYIATVTKSKVGLSPVTLNTSPNEWSPNAYRDMSSLPEDAVVLSAKISATKSSSSKAYNNVLRVKLGNGEYETVTWKSGEIEVPGLVGQKCSCTWYAGFKGSVLTSTPLISMSSFKMTVTYEYDKLADY